MPDDDFPCCRTRDHGPTATEAIQLDVDLLESRLRIARLMASGPLTDEAGS